MKTLLLAATLSISVFATHGMAAGSILAPGTVGEKKLVTKLDHEQLKTSSTWKLGDGEPPISVAKAADLADSARKVQFPDFKDAKVREVSLVSTAKGCYYRVMIWQEVDMEAVANAGGRLKPAQITFFVLLNSTVINPTERD